MSINKTSPILITGGTGVLGTKIVEYLLDRGYRHLTILSRQASSHKLWQQRQEVTYVDADILSLHPLTDIVRDHQAIIHCAAIVSYDPRTFDIMYRVNVEGTTNIVNLALESDVEKLVHISSIAAFGKDEMTTIIDEDSPWINSKYNTYYGITKHLAEREVWRGQVEGLPTVVVNPSVILGDTVWEQSSLAIFKRVYDGLSFYPAGGTGVVDIGDVVAFMVAALEHDGHGERFILNGANLTYLELLTQIAQAMGKNAPSRKANQLVLSALWRIEAVRSRIFGVKPIITSETVRTTSKIVKYDSQKSQAVLGHKYTPVGETIERYSKAYKEWRDRQ